MPKPPYRKLRGYAFDPSLSLQVDTVEVNTIFYKIEWEDLTKRTKNGTATYPVGEIPRKPLVRTLRKKTKGRMLFSADSNYSPEKILTNKPEALSEAE